MVYIEKLGLPVKEVELSTLCQWLKLPRCCHGCVT